MARELRTTLLELVGIVGISDSMKQRVHAVMSESASRQMLGSQGLVSDMMAKQKQHESVV